MSGALLALLAVVAAPAAARAQSTINVCVVENSSVRECRPSDNVDLSDVQLTIN